MAELTPTQREVLRALVDTAVPGTPQAKRIIVGVTVNGRYALPRPTVLSTVVHRPPVTP